MFIYLFLAGFIYLIWRGFYYEPTNVKVDRVRLYDDEGYIIIAHISDLHLNKWRRLHRRLLAQLHREVPDLIVLTGDYVKTKAGYATLARLLEELTRLAPVYAVLGDNDQEEPDEEDRIVTILRNNNVQVLLNQSIQVLLPEQRVYLVGLEDPHLGKADFKKAINHLEWNSQYPTVVLAHSPEVINIPDLQGDLILTGHTHGGQICLPDGIAMLTNTKGVNRKYRGLHSVGNSLLYVNRGLGTARIPARLFCPPELTLIYLGRKSKINTDI